MITNINSTFVSYTDLTGLYTDRGELLLEGSATSLHNLADIINEHTFKEKVFFLKSSNSSLPYPYQGFFSELRVIQEEDTSVEIKRDKTTLVIRGSTSNLEELVFIIRELANSPYSNSKTFGRNHYHVEYFPYITFLASTSQPLEISVENIA